MKQHRLLLGDEALALGAIHAGLSGVYAYPGTPSTEITEFIQGDPLARERKIRSRWCTNEKTAMEAALGMSFCGLRALVCMKHVGMNVCADAFVNSAITGVKGGLVVVAADDPSMHSSQNEQDSRFYGGFAMIPIFEPSCQQEAYDMMAEAFDLSERLSVPVLLRVVTRLAHSRANVEIGEARGQNPLEVSDGKGWVLLPAIARKQYLKLIDKQPLMKEAAETSDFNSLEGDPIKGRRHVDYTPAPMGIIACGIAYNYVKEAAPKKELPILKISQYPIPEKEVKELRERCHTLLVVEDGQPVVENEIKRILSEDYKIYGRLNGYLPRTGELTPDNVAHGLSEALSHAEFIHGAGGGFYGNDEAPLLKPFEEAPASDLVAARPPQFCPGCGHRDVYAALNKVAAEYSTARIFGDIGCYTLGALPPYRSISTCVDMGASITMAKGAADSGLFPSIAVIGDSTFTHSGMTGLLDAVNDHSNITIILSDNLTTAMTGGQDSAGTSKFEAICLGLGVEKDHVRVVVPLPANMPEIERVIREEIQYDGVSVIIPRRECMQTLRRKKK